MHPILTKAYDPASFRKTGHQLVDELADHLEKMRTGNHKTFHWADPDQEFLHWMKDFEEGTSGNLLDFFRTILDHSVQLHSPNYMGHQIAPSVPASALAGLLSDFLNNGMGVYEMGVASSALDKVIIKKMAQQMGLSTATDGVLTSGGTLANLTALLAARSTKASAKIWQQGDQGQLALMVSAEAHYCVDRAVRIMGWGEAGIIKVPTNERYEMRTELLEACYQEAMDAGKEVIAVVGSACTTSTGSFDNLNAIADFCAKHDLWMHVDGAHGAPFALSGTHRNLVAGIERADTIAMDFHKTMATPALTTALFFKDGSRSFHTFRQKADYLFRSEEEEWYNMAKRTFECTKFMMSIKIYAILKTYGFEFFEAFADRLVELGKIFARQVEQHPNFELALMPACNIVCFRRYESGLDENSLNELNDRIRSAILEEGTYYIVKTKLGDSLWLRCTLTNPFTTEEAINGLLERIKAV